MHQIVACEVVCFIAVNSDVQHLFESSSRALRLDRISAPGTLLPVDAVLATAATQADVRNTLDKVVFTPGKALSDGKIKLPHVKNSNSNCEAFCTTLQSFPTAPYRVDLLFFSTKIRRCLLSLRLCRFMLSPKTPESKLTEGCRQCIDTAGLEEAVLQLEAAFGRDALLAFANSIHQKSPRKWDNEEIVRDDGTHGALIVIKPKETIPLHDHPGACGTHLVLGGIAQHHQFSVVGQSEGAWVLRREIQTQRLLQQNSIVSFSTEQGNAHSFVAGDKGCVLLNIFRPSGQPRYWYYPLNDISSQTVVAVRVKREAR